MGFVEDWIDDIEGGKVGGSVRSDTIVVEGREKSLGCERWILSIHVTGSRYGWQINVGRQAGVVLAHLL